MTVKIKLIFIDNGYKKAVVFLFNLPFFTYFIFKRQKPVAF